MSVEEVYQLGSLIEGHSERKQYLEKKLSGLCYAIDQQDARLQNEIDQHNRLLANQQGILEETKSLRSGVDFGEAVIQDVSSTVRERTNLQYVARMSAFVAKRSQVLASLEATEEALTKLEGETLRMKEGSKVTDENLSEVIQIVEGHMREISEREYCSTQISAALQVAREQISTVDQKVLHCKEELSAMTETVRHHAATLHWLETKEAEEAQAHDAAMTSLMVAIACSHRKIVKEAALQAEVDDMSFVEEANLCNWESQIAAANNLLISLRFKHGELRGLLDEALKESHDATSRITELQQEIHANSANLSFAQTEVECAQQRTFDKGRKTISLSLDSIKDDINQTVESLRTLEQKIASLEDQLNNSEPEDMTTELFLVTRQLKENIAVKLKLFDEMDALDAGDSRTKSELQGLKETDASLEKDLEEKKKEDQDLTTLEQKLEGEETHLRTQSLSIPRGQTNIVTKKYGKAAEVLGERIGKTRSQLNKSELNLSEQKDKNQEDSEKQRQIFMGSQTIARTKKAISAYTREHRKRVAELKAQLMKDDQKFQAAFTSVEQSLSSCEMDAIRELDGAIQLTESLRAEKAAVEAKIKGTSSLEIEDQSRPRGPLLPLDANVPRAGQQSRGKRHSEKKSGPTKTKFGRL